MALGEHELRFVLSHDFRLVEREFAVMLVVHMGWTKEVMSVWSKRGRGGIVGPGIIPQSSYSLFYEAKEVEGISSQGIALSRRGPLIMVVDGSSEALVGTEGIPGLR